MMVYIEEVIAIIIALFALIFYVTGLYFLLDKNRRDKMLQDLYKVYYCGICGHVPETKEEECASCGEPLLINVPVKK